MREYHDTSLTRYVQIPRSSSVLAPLLFYKKSLGREDDRRWSLEEAKKTAVVYNLRDSIVVVNVTLTVANHDVHIHSSSARP